MIAHATALTADATTTTASHAGATLVSTDGRILPLRATSISGRAGAGICRARLTQTFVNDHAEPLHVVYQVPLPADGAVSGYRFVIGEREINGRIDRRTAARRAFSEAVLSGRTAALLEQDRTSVFRQEIGNVPAGATITIVLTIDQPLVWSAELGGSWEWRFPTVVAPRYLGAPGRVVDADRISPNVTLDRMPVGMSLRLDIEETTLGVESPTHPIRSTSGKLTAVELADGDAPLDRDVVVRWRVASPTASSSILVARQGDDAHALLTLVPPEVDALARTPHVVRDLIVLLDTSGSMSGAPLAQSKRIAAALVDRLEAHDRLELIEFSTSPRSWRSAPVFADFTARQSAKAWIAGLQASGGTEMRTGIHAALVNLRPEAQRQVVLVTDGQIGFESEIVGKIHGALPTGCRVHTVGVGSGVNRSLTSPAARAGRGTEIVIGIDEDAERAVTKLLAHTDAPQIVDLQLDGDALVEHAPMHLPDLMAGMPARISLRVRAEGGTLRVRGRTATGAWEQRIAVPPCDLDSGNPGVISRFGREKVEDLELRVAAGERGLDEAIEILGLDYTIATRLTSWIAIDTIVSVDPTEPTRREVMPHQLPHGMSVCGVGLRAPSSEVASGGGEMMMRSVIYSPPGEDMRMEGSGGRASARKKTEQAPASAAPRPAAPRQAPAAPAAAAPPSVSDGRRGGAVDDEDDAPDAAPALETDGLAEEQGERTMRTRAFGATQRSLTIKGEFSRLADGTLILEIEITEAIDWIAPSSIALTIGQVPCSAVVDATRTTRNGKITPGMRIRVCCTSVPTGEVSNARFTVGGLVFLVHA